MIGSAERSSCAAPGGAAVHDPFNAVHSDSPSTNLGLQLPFTGQSKDRSMLLSNLLSYLPVGQQATNELTPTAVPEHGLNHLEPVHQDSGSGEPVSRDRTGWDTATAGSAPDSKGDAKQNKCERQQMLNKAAQQRCDNSSQNCESPRNPC
jgi:hypothetical protein